MRRCRNRSGFTLIEVLVVVAIIALLVAILMPSLARARAQTRMVLCQTNLKQLGNAFAVYTAENKGALPGSRADEEADWLGGDNKPHTGFGYRGDRGRQPEGGTIWKYMGKQKFAYTCADDDKAGRIAANPEWQTALNRGDWYFSYTSNLLLSGAKTEMLTTSHYRRAQNATDPLNYSETNHTANMRSFEGVPLLIEEDLQNSLAWEDDSGWCNVDAITNRHLKGGSMPGYGNVMFHDSHVTRVQLPPPTSVRLGQKYFVANSMCVRTKGGKWVSGRSWDLRSAMYGALDDAPPASDEGVMH